MSIVFRSALLMLFLLSTLFMGKSVSALDFEDVMTMKRNGLSDEVIAEQVRLAGGVSMSVEQSGRLRGAGASDILILVMNTVHASPSTASASIPPSDAVLSRTVVAAPSASGPVRSVPVTAIGALPDLCAREGWLSVANSDTMNYYLLFSPGNKRGFLSRNPNGGVEIPPGHEISFNLRKETYKLYGDSGNSLSIKIREGEPTRLSLIPFGVVGNSGLTGTVRDRDRVRSEVLFGNYMPPTVVVRPPVVIAEPPPMMVVPYHYRPYQRRHYYGHWW